MNNPLSLALGLLIWVSVMWDGFATMVLPRTVVPMRRLSGRFYNLSWQLWSLIARRIRTGERRLAFLAIFGPLSVMLLLVIWAGLAVVAFALIYHGSGSRFLEKGSPVGFGTLLYMSGSTFLTLGLGDVTSADSLGRMFMVFEAATGFVFLGLIITYMPLLDQAYASREVGGLLLQSRAGKPPNAVRLLRRYAGTDRSEILRGNLREERALDGRHPAEPPLPPRIVLLSGPALRAVVAGLSDDRDGHLLALDRRRRGPCPRAGAAHLSNGAALAGRPGQRARAQGTDTGRLETERGRPARALRRPCRARESPCDSDRPKEPSSCGSIIAMMSIFMPWPGG